MTGINICFNRVHVERCEDITSGAHRGGGNILVYGNQRLVYSAQLFLCSFGELSLQSYTYFVHSAAQLDIYRPADKVYEALCL